MDSGTYSIMMVHCNNSIAGPVCNDLIVREKMIYPYY